MHYSVLHEERQRHHSPRSQTAARALNRLSRQLGRSRSDLVRDALRRQIALLCFEQARRGLLPLAEARGILTDEDVFDRVS